MTVFVWRYWSYDPIETTAVSIFGAFKFGAKFGTSTVETSGSGGGSRVIDIIYWEEP